MSRDPSPPTEHPWDKRPPRPEDIPALREYERLNGGYGSLFGNRGVPGRGRGRGRPAKRGRGGAPGYITHISHDFHVHRDESGQYSSQAIPVLEPLGPVHPDELADAFSGLQFTSQTSTDEEMRPHDVGTAHAMVDGTGDLYTDEPEPDTGKRKRYTSSDDPMKEWMPWVDLMLEEATRRHGLGGATAEPCCTTCGISFVAATKESHTDGEETSAVKDTACTEGGSSDNPQSTHELFRCKSCGDFLECRKCVCTRHARSPLHFLEVWRGDYFERTTLRELGLVYQVGHGGAPCPNPDDKTPRLMTVVHTTGIHTVSFHYCNCIWADRQLRWQQLLRTGWYPATTHTPQTCATIEVLDLYRRLKVMATVNVRDYVSCLENLTDAWGTEWTPDRYKAFARMARQWALLMRVRWSGVAFEVGGLSKAAWGSVAVECWACPRVGVNLPLGWENVDENHRYRFRRIVSNDANFRYSEKMRVLAHPDPPLYSGLGVQVPVELYHEWLKTHITEEEMSTCVSFAALMQKDTRFSVGLRWSGVIGVICARHEVMLGLGDLEKGERYKNTDFVLYWLLSRMGLKEVTITYDIACQYKKHFLERIKALPAALQNLPLPKLWWALPVWHGNVHEISCESAESLKYKVGVGKTDGEGVERVWSLLNPMAYMLKEEHPGARHDDIEDKVNLQNFQKNVTLGHSLLRRLRIALEERAVQIDAFKEVNSTLKKPLQRDWLDMVLAWLDDNTKPNLYAPSGKVRYTEARARLDLRKAEAEEEAASASPTSGKSGRVSMAGMVIIGLQILDRQARIKIDKADTSLTLDAEAKIHDHRRSLTAKLKEFRKWQAVYMLGVPLILEAEEETRRARNAAPPLIEDVTLYLPSDCTGILKAACLASPKVFEMEAAIRRGRCEDAIAHLRGRLLAQRHLNNFRNKNLTGQVKTTRAATLFASIGKKVKEAAAAYRRSRAAVIALEGEDAAKTLLELKDSDVEVFEVAESDAEAVKKLGRLGRGDSRVTASKSEKKRDKSAKKAAKRRDAPGESKRTMSWIWTSGGGTDAQEDGFMHECVRIEWAKALARKTRWEEEVELLQEEMRRTLRSLVWEEKEWRRRSLVEGFPELRMEEVAGRRAYCLRQVKARQDVRASFESLWLETTPARGQKAGPMDAAASGIMAKLLEREHAGDGGAESGSDTAPDMFADFAGDRDGSAETAMTS